MPGYFSKEAFRFLSDLKAHNDREWFKRNKDRYEEHVREPCLEFIVDAGPRLAKISSHIRADPRPVGGSLFRIHRDIRFSRDKSPYKTHAGLTFHGSAKGTPGPGYYLHIEPGGCFLVGGIYIPDPKTLRMIRETIAGRPSEWKRVRGSVSSTSERLVRAPQGFDSAHPLIEDIKLKSFMGGPRFTDAAVCRSDFMQRFIEGCKSVAPLMRFLASSVGAPW